MKAETLQIARTLDFKINGLKRALGCFEYTHEGKKISLNPKIIIEFDSDGREQEELPFSLNEDMIDYLKQYIKKEIEIAEKEFEAL